MRFLNKYKLHENFASGSQKLPLRVLKFKRTKWAIIKKKLLIRKRKVFKNKNFEKKPKSKFGKKILFSDLGKIKIKKRIFFNKVFTRKLQTRKYVSSLYDNSIKFTGHKKQKYRNNLIASVLVKPLYRIDILLWYLNFFASSWSARKFVSSGHVYVNNKQVFLNYIIKGGDVITFDLPEPLEGENAYILIKARFLKEVTFFPFLQYDYYTNTFIVLKSWHELTENDFAVLFNKYINVSHLLDK